MSVLQEQFARAQKDVNELTSRPDNGTLLTLYGYYKQATEGDVTGERPGGFDFVRQAKFDAWCKMKGMSRQQAMENYIKLVTSLKN